ncbi:MAG: hypothetical protein HUK00_00725 [Bacteroidaceae bacterium]|nr:hypothetical protein [Bacteroidaceae bacterium]
MKTRTSNNAPATATPTTTAPKNGWQKTLSRIAASPALFFVAVWAWSWLWWGDVIWTAHERSFFAFECELVQHVWSRPLGSLWVAGRALLALYAWPWLGSLVFAVLLTGVACCLKRIFRARRLAALCYLPSVAWVAWLTFTSFNVYFKGEPGRIFGIPMLVLILVGVLAALTSLRRRAAAEPKPDFRFAWALNLLPFALLALTAVWETQYRPWTRPTGTMERLYADEDWDGIRKTATDNATITCRPMSAYYAIALVRQDAIMKHLFDIRFEYDSIYMYDWEGQLMNETSYYVSECDLHAGLAQFAYHKAMEDMTMDGPTLHNLKLLTQVTALRHEDKVARKYLNVLSRTLGTTDFVEKWSAYLADTVKMEKDPTVAGIRRLEPLHDNFESSYTDPAFLGYNLSLFEGRSRQALINSVAVCLYTKLMPPFIERAQYLGEEGVLQNPIIADALAMQANKQPGILEALPSLKLNLQRYQSFVRRMQALGATGNTQERIPYADGLFHESRGYYPYYYYFGNLRATRSDAAAKYGYGQSDGVN